MNKIIGLMLIIILSGCSENEHFKSSEEFKNEVNTWNVVGQNIQLAKETALRNGFFCTEYTCNKDLHGFPCSQKLKVTFSVNTDNKVQEFSVWEINGNLPSACL